LQNARSGAGHRDTNTRIRNDAKGMLRFSNAKCEVRCGAPRQKQKDSQRCQRHVVVFECKMRAAVRGTAIKTQGFTRTSQTCCDIRIQQLSASLQKVRWEFCEIQWPPRANRSGRWAPQPANCGGRQPVVETLYRKQFVLPVLEREPKPEGMEARKKRTDTILRK